MGHIRMGVCFVLVLLGMVVCGSGIGQNLVNEDLVIKAGKSLRQNHGSLNLTLDNNFFGRLSISEEKEEGEKQNLSKKKDLSLKEQVYEVEGLPISEDLSSLKLVHLLYRHGDRTPCDPYPKDPYNDMKYWPEGLGQLTSRGKMMHFKLGQWLRQRYSGFIGTDYNHKEITVRSTNVDRTLMSALSNLAGLYPPSGTWQWNTDLEWQPIPVHTLPQELDNLLSVKVSCPRQSQLIEELAASEEMENLYQDNIDLFQYISFHTGRELRSVWDLDYIYDTLLVETIHNLTLPSWTDPIFPGGQFSRLRDLSFVMNTYTHEMKRLCGGPFINKLTSDWDKVITNTMDPKERKVFMYSGHDTTVSMVLDTLGVFDGLAPPYASLVMFELHRLKANKTSGDPWAVRLLYRNTTTSPPFPLHLPGCGDPCPLQTFKELTESVRPTDWVKECHISTKDSMKADDLKTPVDGAMTNVLLLSLVIVLLVSCLVLGFTLHRQRNRNNYNRV